MRERLYVHEDEVPRFLARMKETLAECLILSTCNRTEVYGVTDSPDIDPHFYKELLIDFKNAHSLVRDEHFFTLISCAACQQLFSVATGIDSKVVGDTQILKQLRGAYALARENDSAGKVLNQLLQRAFKIGKKTYTETSIHAGAVSVSLAAVETAIRTFGSLQDRSVLIIGAGETARLTAEALVNKRVGRILLSNRTRSHAEELLTVLGRNFSFEGEIIDFENFKSHLVDADIVISSTGSPKPILKQRDFVNQARKILLIDIAVPRDIERAAAEHPSVILKNVDDLNLIVDSAFERRMKDLPKVKKLIKTEMADFLMWYYALPLMPSYESTGSRPAPARTRKILKIKEFLGQNVSEIHKLARLSGGDFRKDLENHFSLVRRLQTKAVEAAAV